MSHSPSPSIDLPEVSFFGRSFAEYLAFFGLDADALPGKRILDCAAGPSSFALEADKAGANVTAVDPHYAKTEPALRMIHETSFSQMFGQMRAKKEMFATTTFPSIEAAEADRREAAQAFLDDYYSGTAVGRYVAGKLPELPFKNDTFDLTLCGHLLFVYDKLFDLPFHLRTCCELLRVTRPDTEARIHPVVDSSGQRSQLVEPLLVELRGMGVDCEIRPADYAFFRGATDTLVMRQTG